MPSISLPDARAALVAAGITGPHQSHSKHNVISKINALIGDEEPEDSFGLSGFSRYSAHEILGFVAELTGCSTDIDDFEGVHTIDPDLTIAGILAAARRLRAAAVRGQTLIAATGHPTGLLEHHIHVVEAYCAAGGKILRLREDERFLARKGRHAEVRYVGGVGCLADWGSLHHTHSAAPMVAVLESEPWPDIVLGDHGFAGAALERGIPTIAVMDVNDPALAVAWADRKDVVIVPMDDNRLPRLYEPSWSLFEQVLSGEFQ